MGFVTVTESLVIQTDIKTPYSQIIENLKRFRIFLEIIRRNSTVNFI